MKKNIILSIVGVLVVIGSFLLGAYMMTRSAENAPAASEETVNQKFSEEQISSITALTPGNIVSGQVITIGSNELDISVAIENVFDELADPQMTTVKVPVNKQDVISRLVNDPEAFIFKQTIMPLSEIKIGDYATVKVLDDKKVIFVTSQ
ncbi:MAG: hypothetical protein UW32_C0001G0081 [Candidatus Wolfebacteria bacterium GW2011_GWE2_44_13]|uniref:Uncharacterized protein n=1 Tax=Candidatus Wolfebacteria bacterium GW2011_GWE2_44_13 TaxID=1619017 RepID=A0A0G1K6K1_9BACT|nr:MAG: hypothetical protein UW32_C0001G0081 [Candidatus Wolfebacteria bacterium GW2011_GWE2_44_13]